MSAQPSEALIAWKRRHVRLPPILEALSAARRGHRGVQHARHRGGHARIPAAVRNDERLSVLLATASKTALWQSGSRKAPKLAVS